MVHYNCSTRYVVAASFQITGLQNSTARIIPITTRTINRFRNQLFGQFQRMDGLRKKLSQQFQLIYITQNQLLRQFQIIDSLWQQSSAQFQQINNLGGPFVWTIPIDWKHQTAIFRTIPVNKGQSLKTVARTILTYSLQYNLSGQIPFVTKHQTLTK